MKPLPISFSGGTFRYWRPRPGERYPLAILLSLGGIACCISLAFSVFNQSQAEEHLTELAERLNQRLARNQPARLTPIRGPSPAKLEAVKGAIDKLNAPWRDLLDSVDQATPRHIALISLEPDVGTKTLVVIGEASSAGSMLDYVGRLKKQPLFTQVLLVRHEINKQDPNSPYRFQLEARWKATAR